MKRQGTGTNCSLCRCVARLTEPSHLPFRILEGGWAITTAAMACAHPMLTHMAEPGSGRLGYKDNLSVFGDCSSGPFSALHIFQSALLHVRYSNWLRTKTGPLKCGQKPRTRDGSSTVARLTQPIDLCTQAVKEKPSNLSHVECPSATSRCPDPV